MTNENQEIEKPEIKQISPEKFEEMTKVSVEETAKYLGLCAGSVYAIMKKKGIKADGRKRSGRRPKVIIK